MRGHIAIRLLDCFESHLLAASKLNVFFCTIIKNSITGGPTLIETTKNENYNELYLPELIICTLGLFEEDCHLS